MIEVYHAFNTRDSLFLTNEDVTSEMVRNFKTNGEYRLVASVETSDLDKAYELTNTIHHLWTTNPEVHQPLSHYLRSTSVGDILVHNDKAYLVVGVGFEEIPKVT